MRKRDCRLACPTLSFVIWILSSCRLEFEKNPVRNKEQKSDFHKMICVYLLVCRRAPCIHTGGDLICSATREIYENRDECRARIPGRRGSPRWKASPSSRVRAHDPALAGSAVPMRWR